MARMLLRQRRTVGDAPHERLDTVLPQVAVPQGQFARVTRRTITRAAVQAVVTPRSNERTASLRIPGPRSGNRARTVGDSPDSHGQAAAIPASFRSSSSMMSAGMALSTPYHRLRSTSKQRAGGDPSESGAPEATLGDAASPGLATLEEGTEPLKAAIERPADLLAKIVQEEKEVEAAAQQAKMKVLSDAEVDAQFASLMRNWQPEPKTFLELSSAKAGDSSTTFPAYAKTPSFMMTLSRDLSGQWTTTTTSPSDRATATPSSAASSWAPGSSIAPRYLDRMASLSGSDAILDAQDTLESLNLEDDRRVVDKESVGHMILGASVGMELDSNDNVRNRRRSSLLQGGASAWDLEKSAPTVLVEEPEEDSPTERKEIKAALSKQSDRISRVVSRVRAKITAARGEFVQDPKEDASSGQEPEQQQQRSESLQPPKAPMKKLMLARGPASLQ